MKKSIAKIFYQQNIGSLLRSVNEKSRLYMIRIEYPSLDNIIRFIDFKNVLVKTLRMSQKRFVKDLKILLGIWTHLKNKLGA